MGFSPETPHQAGKLIVARDRALSPIGTSVLKNALPIPPNHFRPPQQLFFALPRHTHADSSVVTVAVSHLSLTPPRRVVYIMAAAGARAQKPVGSAAWIAAEKENMAELVEQEMEEIEYPVRHEMDWLNEHMAEIFSKGQANFTDVFKTPGKMRGKTPRTARKHNLEESRMVSFMSRVVCDAVFHYTKLTGKPQPLSEIFSSSHKQVENKAISPSPFIHRVVSKTTTNSSIAPPRPKAAVDVALQPQYPDLSQNLNSFTKFNTDSGYHGMEDDDVFRSDTQPETQPSTLPTQIEEPASSSHVDISMSQQTTEDSFHSAQENVRARGETVEPANAEPTPTQERNAPAEPISRDLDTEMNDTPKAKAQPKPKVNLSSRNDELASTLRSSPTKSPGANVTKIQEPEDEDVNMEDPHKEDAVLDNFDDIGSPSDNSTPERLERVPVRKSSLSFASLPAREPLTKAMGGSRVSRTSHIDLPKINNTSGRPSYLNRLTGSHKPTQAALDDDSDGMDIDVEKESETTVRGHGSKTRNTRTTQTLHERISMLGKHQAPRPTKSISAAGGLSSAGQVAYPELPAAKVDPASQRPREPSASGAKADEDDWIKPLSSPPRPVLAKSKTADVMEKLIDTEKEQSVGKQDPRGFKQQSVEPERPKSSASIFPPLDLMAISKALLHPTFSQVEPQHQLGPLAALMGLFTSSGSSIRLDASSPDQPRVQPKDRASADKEDVDMDRPESQPRPKSSPAKPETRRTRSSTEKEQKQRQKDLEDRRREEALRQEKAREQDKQRALQQRAMQEKSSVEPEERPGTSYKPSQSVRQQSREPESSIDDSRIALPQPKQNDRRPKPTREPMQKPKPQPVSIRVGSTLSRPMPVSSSISSGAQESSAPAPVAPQSTSAPKQQGLKKKGSNASLQTASSTNSFKSSVSSQTQAQRKAQLASEKKREQEDQKARQREEQKREQERKRLTQQQQDDARRRAEAKRDRRDRAALEDPKKAAQKQAIEQRRLENARRQERQGSQQPNNEAPMSYHDKSASQSSQNSQRNDLGANRPPSRLGSSVQPYGRINPPAPNPARPPKRQPDEDAGQRAAVRKPSNVHAYGEAKRRKTEDEHNPMQQVRPPMAPPDSPLQYAQGMVRMLTTHLEQISTLGQSGMPHQAGSSVLQSGQAQRPTNAMNKFATGKIPFAEPNAVAPPAAHKAPQRAPAPAKASPKYPSGESIHLPEIATDSEDEDDSDSGMFPVPQWAQTKELERLLRIQDGMEVDSIFGPIAPFSLEETFKSDKKIKKYRDRTSSANWSGPDGLTQEEIRKDVADRQRLRLNGGWSFNPGA
ncbi:hypothetical protein N7468_009697 [Penicillium chermesinum]|uniref:Inner centromere protein ARK-binding domain-containing protein n=1 Tax=Penicillium chermesinum TaxID=63820 RepID=A0A9W9NKW3_9EURO|nr:uncharacterized protein N7468_009697 [Penicillium chermesinum]KAJ5220493.1 hypothetical protein N7468_009697 [Penicillium chermesinum]